MHAKRLEFVHKPIENTQKMQSESELALLHSKIEDQISKLPVLSSTA